MAKKPVKRKNRARITEVIEEAASRAADDALDELDLADTGFETPTDQLDQDFIDRQVASPAFDAEVDVFEFTAKECQKRNDLAKFWIYKNSEFLCVKDYPYGIEQLQREYGAGFYKISGRSRKTGQVIKVASETIAALPGSGVHEEQDVEAAPQASPFDFMLQMDRVRQESKHDAERSAQQQTSTLAAMMTALTQSQQAQMQQMQTMMIENSKLAQAQIAAAQAQAQKSSESTLTLLITMLSKKDDGPKGLSPIELIKLLEERERRVEERERRSQERMEKIRDEFADSRAAENDGEEKESLTQSIIKGFIPIIANMQQQQSQQQAMNGQAPTPEQQLQLQLEHDRRRVEQQNRQNAEINRRKQAQSAGQPNVTTAPGPVVTQPQTVTPQIVPVEPRGAVNQGEVPVTNIRERLQAQIFDYVKEDLAKALMESASASKTATETLEKLAKVDVTRQNVLDVFTLQDFMRIAELNGVPLGLAGAWLEEFYNTIKTPPAAPSPAPVESAGKSPTAVGTTVPPRPRRAAGGQSQQSAKNLRN